MISQLWVGCANCSDAVDIGKNKLLEIIIMLLALARPLQ